MEKTAQKSSVLGNNVRKMPIDRLVPGGLITLFIAFSTTILVALFVLVDRHQADIAERNLIRSAEIMSENISDFRAYYSQEIISNLRDSDVVVSHQYREIEGAVPLPATMSIELGEYLDKKESAVRFRMYSDMPFPWRGDRVLDQFQKNALRAVQADPSQSVTETVAIDGVAYLRYVSAVTMAESCIGCHNARPESPFRSWSVGDVRGVQEVLISTGPAESYLSQSATFRDIIFFVVVAFGSGMIVIVFLARQNSKAFVEIENAALFEQNRSSQLQSYQLQLEEGMGRLNAVLNNVADAIVTIDERGIIQSANPATERMFGLPIGGLIGQNVSILMPGDMAARHDGFLTAYAETGHSKIIGTGRELAGQRADGSVFPLELSISKVELDDRTLFTGILRDITSRKAVEQSLRESERKARTLSLVADRTDNAVIITDAIGHIEWVNGGFERISGFKLEEIIGRKPAEFLQGEETSSDQTAYMRSKIGSGEPFTAEVVNYTKDKTPYWVQIDAQPIYGAKGELEHYIAIERDVTGVKQREAELEEAKLRAEEGSETKTRFLAMMSHEIPTPLNGVLGALNLLEDGSLNAEQKRLTAVGRKAGENLLSIINDVLDISKMEAGHLDLETSPIDPAQVVQDVMDIMQNRASEKGLTLTSRIDSALPRFVVGDAARLRQVLLNFVSNAVKFTETGSVTIKLGAGEVRDREAQLTFEVTDTGVGLSEVAVSKLFEEFWRAGDTKTRTIEGTGLGLAICQRIVDRMEGQIDVKSEEGVGSTFSFTVPLTLPSDIDISGSRTTSGTTEGEDQALPSFNGRALVAEDSSANQLIIKIMMERAGLAVDLVANGEEAVSAARNNPYDLIFMDINMPVMDGVTATSTIREIKDPKVTAPIIAMTAFTMSGDREEILDKGLDDYISKPINKKQLYAMLAKWLG